MMWKDLPTPCYVVDEGKIRKNLEILSDLEQECGCHILLAQKAFSMYSLYPMIGQYISGTTASGLYEARLGYEEMGKETPVFLPRRIKKKIWKNWCRSATISFSIPLHSMRNIKTCAEKVQRCGKIKKQSVSASASIRSVPRRKDMRSMIRAAMLPDLV